LCFLDANNDALKNQDGKLEGEGVLPQCLMTWGKLSMRVYWVASISTGRRCEFALTVVVGHNHQATTFKCANDGRRNHLVAIIKNQTDIIISQIIFGIKLYRFRTVPLSIIRSFSLYAQQWYVPYRFVDSLRAGSERNSVPS